MHENTPNTGSIENRLLLSRPHLSPLMSLYNRLAQLSYPAKRLQNFLETSHRHLSIVNSLNITHRQDRYWQYQSQFGLAFPVFLERCLFRNRATLRSRIDNEAHESITQPPVTWNHTRHPFSIVHNDKDDHKRVNRDKPVSQEHKTSSIVRYNLAQSQLYDTGESVLNGV